MEAAITIILLLALGTFAEEPRALHSLCHYLDLGKETVSDLGNTKKCFAQYLPELESQGATWSQGYSGCEKKASSEQQSVLLKANVAQENIREAALGIIDFIDDCLTLTETQEFFNCFAKMAKLQLTKVYNISFNASEQALILNKHMSSIEIICAQIKRKKLMLKARIRYFNHWINVFNKMKRIKAIKYIYSCIIL